jgi:phage terminase large subunit-like protein
MLRESNSRREATRPSERSPFAAGWRWKGFTSPIGAWYPELRSELLSFPAGKHDDQVDALGLVGQLLDKMTARLG